MTDDKGRFYWAMVSDLRALMARADDWASVNKSSEKIEEAKKFRPLII